MSPLRPVAVDDEQLSVDTPVPAREDAILSLALSEALVALD